MPSPVPGDDYIIEFRRLGSAVKVSACDPATLVEVCIVGSIHSPDWMLERTAVRKLEAALAKRRG
ncbi:MAG: DUF6898 family protein [Alphaproteobacteria bacterium]